MEGLSVIQESNKYYAEALEGFKEIEGKLHPSVNNKEGAPKQPQEV